MADLEALRNKAVQATNKVTREEVSVTEVNRSGDNKIEENINLTSPRVNPYVITDAIAASVLIDGLTILEFLTTPLLVLGASKIASPYVLPIIGANSASFLYTGLSSIFPIVNSPQEFLFSVGVSIAGGFTTYTIRDYTRADFKDAGLDHFNGILGGGIKYAGSELANQLYEGKDLSVSSIAIKASLGGGNNYAYEKCSSITECNEDNYNIVRIEFGETIISTAGSYIYQDKVNNPISFAYQLMSGYMIGEMVKFNFEQAFAPNIASIHRISDVICEEFPSLITAKDKLTDSFTFTAESISSAVSAMHDLYNYTYIKYMGVSDIQEL